MNATELATSLMSELKSMCAANSLEVIGDKRSKSTYILAIETFQSEQTVIEIIEMPAIPDPFALPVVEAVTASSHQTMAESIVQGTGYANETPANEPLTPTNQHRGASIVVLIPLILLTVAVILIKIGISTIIPIIGSLMSFMGSIWQSSITGNAIGKSSIPLDYFPA